MAMGSVEKKCIASFCLGVAICILFNYLMNDRRDREMRNLIDACYYVWEAYQSPTIVTVDGYWEYQGLKCKVFDNGGFRDLNEFEYNALAASLESNIRDY